MRSRLPLALCALALMAGCDASSTTTSGTSASSTPSSSAPGTASGSDSPTASGSASSDTGLGAELQGKLNAAFADGATGSVEIVMGQVTSEGDFAVKGDHVDQAVTMSSNGTEIQARVVDGVTYLHNPALAPKWIQVDDRLAAVTIGTLSGADPLVVGKSLQKAKVTSVKSGGGAGSTAYRVSIPIADYFAAAGKAKPSIPRLAKAASVVITLDADGKPLTIENDLGFTSVSTTYSDWGKEVAIVAPGKDEIGPLPTASPSS